MARAHKAKAVSRYIVSHSEVIGISWDGTINNLVAPYPYHFNITTNPKDEILYSSVKNLPREKISAVIRYDKWIDSIPDAVVSMRLSDFVKFLGAHSEITNRGRGEGN